MYSSEICCFWMEPMARCQVSLRRFAFDESGRCPLPRGLHDVSRFLEDEDYPLDDTTGRGDVPSIEQRRELKWPTLCGCGYAFQESDQWQIFRARYYRSEARNLEAPISAFPPGAMYDAHWYRDCEEYKVGPDGVCLMVVTPHGPWCVDGPARGGGGWARKGTIPQVTVSPSIAQPTYHGWLTAGVLKSC